MLTSFRSRLFTGQTFSPPPAFLSRVVVPNVTSTPCIHNIEHSHLGRPPVCPAYARLKLSIFFSTIPSRSSNVPHPTASISRTPPASPLHPVLTLLRHLSAFIPHAMHLLVTHPSSVFHGIVPCTPLQECAMHLSNQLSLVNAFPDDFHIGILTSSLIRPLILYALSLLLAFGPTSRLPPALTYTFLAAFRAHLPEDPSSMMRFNQEVNGLMYIEHPETTRSPIGNSEEAGDAARTTHEPVDA